MNWLDYLCFVGDIFGVLLVIEVLLVFFMEFIFFGLWMFIWDNKKISKKLYVIFIWLVVFGLLMLVMWIFIVNSFM